VAEGDSEGAIITSGGGLAVAVISRNQVRVRDLVIGVASDVRIVQGRWVAARPTGLEER
jgi:hypothetical protein